MKNLAVIILLMTLGQYAFSSEEALEEQPVFFTKARASHCYQDPQEAWTSAKDEIQLTAELVCKPFKAKRVTEYDSRLLTGCTIEFEAGYICF